MSLTETILSFALFSLLTVMLALALKEGADIWRRVEGSADSRTQLRLARNRLAPELAATAFTQVSTTPCPKSLGSGFDGDAVWFLSAIDPTSGLAMRKSDGTPFWQRTILYYVAVPSDHANLFGSTCAGGADANGYDDRCPHKFLIRKVIDNPPATNPADESTQEVLIPAGSISTYLTRPVGYNLSSMLSEAGVSEARVVAHGLLYGRVSLAPSSNCPHEILIDLRAINEKTARRQVAVGSAALGKGPFTTQELFSIVPGLP